MKTPEKGNPKPDAPLQQEPPGRRGCMSLICCCVALPFCVLACLLLSEDDDGPWRLGALPTNAREAAAHAIPPA